MSKALIFSGQGAQKVGMGQSLCETFPSVRILYERADELLGWSLSNISFGGPEDELTLTRVCQPALYVHGYAVFSVLRERGLGDLHTAMGLSLGELTALAAAEAFDFETGLRLVAERGRLMQEACDATEGAMASMIGGSVEAVQALCQEFDVDMANLNCPGQTVISGESAKVASAVEAAKASGGFKMVVPLKVAGAYHSRLMEPAREAFAAFLDKADISAPTLTVRSNVHAEPLPTPAAIRDALSRQVVSPVRWEDCMRAAAAEVESFIECGMGGVLAGLAKRTDRSWKVQSLQEAADLA